MFIKKIQLDNFRIYKGVNELYFEADEHKNLHIISGYNGFGKTTLLTSLVWCLYGGQMQDVDDSFRRRIRDAGGYPKFLEGCLNRIAALEFDTKYSVSILLTNLKISGIVANEVEVRRTFILGDKSDQLEIFLDGTKNGLVQDVGNDIFVQDFILPKEIAKFFFFDAEKITSLAENQSFEEKRQLGRAYAEVLGIKKYLDLKTNLVDLRLKYKKESASSIDITQYKELEIDISNLEQSLSLTEQNKAQIKAKMIEIEDQIVVLQTKLWRIGTTLDIDELVKLRNKKEQLQKVSEELKESFKSLLDFAPFAIAGKIFFETIQAAKITFEKRQRNSAVIGQIAIIRENLQNILSGLQEVLDKQKVITSLSPILDQLANINSVDKVDVSNTRLNISEDMFNEMLAIEKQLKFSYKDEFKRLSKEVKRNRYELNEVSRKLFHAESKENDNSVKHLQLKLNSVQNLKKSIESDIELHTIDSIRIQNELNIKKKVLSEFQKKIDVKEDLREKDDIASRLINELDQFILNIQKEKKHLLENSICKSLNSLMHKKNFVKLVSISIDGEVISIDLLNDSGDKINKEDLSMGEKQLYATAIFQALVKESQIEFPVFIDSPMQKLDISHAQNILKYFYPKVSKQVVILPLLNKEISEFEYKIIEDHVKSCHLIVHNVQEESSSIQKINNKNLFSYAPDNELNSSYV